MRTIHHVVDIDANPKDVWSALTVQDRMAGWWTTSVDAPDAEVGTRVRWTFTDEFSPLMEITAADEPSELGWRCVDGHQPWMDNTFRFVVATLDDGHTRLRFWQEYATELSDDAYGTYNFNWAYYLESLRLLCSTGTGKPFSAPAVA